MAFGIFFSLGVSTAHPSFQYLGGGGGGFALKNFPPNENEFLKFYMFF